MATTLLAYVSAQLRDELGLVAGNLTSLVAPDEAIGWDLQQRANRSSEAIAWSISSPFDTEANKAVACLMAVLWRYASPEDVGRADWWRTPLGRACARPLSRTDTAAVTHSVAAAMLGVTRGTIAQWVARGTLDRHPDGGVLRASVLQRIARQ